MKSVVFRSSRSRRPALMLASLAVLALLSPPAARAAQGDCSQPVSTGTGPTTSDCLLILKVAVGSRTCSPACICAPGGTLPTKTSDALLCLRKAVGQSVTLNCPCEALPVGDDFNDNSVDPLRWGLDDLAGNGVLTETSQVLRYTVSSGTADDFASRPWIASELPYDADWEVQVDVTNFTVPDEDDQVNSYGIVIFDAGDFGNQFFAELYASHFGGPPARNGFYGELYDDFNFVELVDTLGIDDLEVGAVRIVFDADSKVATLYYDINPANGYQWVEFGSFGVDGSGGEDANADWGLGSSDRFVVNVYGYSSEMAIGPGEMYGDNFKVTGGVEP